jgi:toxin ParE1/3/4
LKVNFTDNAIQHLLGIYEFIGSASDIYAKATIDKLTRRSEQIAKFPMSGRMVPEYENENIREVIERPYRIIYLIKQDEIDILAVIHSAKYTYFE